MRQAPLIIILAAAVTGLIGLAGCASEPTARVGFLSDYSKLGPSPFPDARGAQSYFNPDKPLGQYSAFIVEPVQVILSPQAEQRDLEPAKLNELAAYFRNQVIAELEASQYAVVGAPGAGTIRVRAALTDVEPANPLLNIHPAMIVSGVGLGGASMEAELLDSQTGEVVAAVVDTQKGSRGFDGLTKYGNAEDVIDRWAKRLVIRMDEASGKTR